MKSKFPGALPMFAMGLLSLIAAVWTVSLHSQTRWKLPVTIEALQDVPARVEETAGQQRGVLYLSRGPSFIVKKGARFRMVKINAEGGCRIEFEKQQHDVTSCPWLDGFRDHQADVFKVVSVPSPAIRLGR